MRKLQKPNSNPNMIISRVARARSGKLKNYLKNYLIKWKAECCQYIQDMERKKVLDRADYLDVSALKNSFINLYDSADVDNERKYIKDMRIKSKGMICPYCGRPGCGTLDHYYPKDKFPQFSILENNLIPCCWGCNKVKLSSWSSNPMQRFINPYYDSFLESFIFDINFELINQVIAFKILPSQTLEPNYKPVVEFHIRQIELQEYHCESILLAFQKYSKFIQHQVITGLPITDVKKVLGQLIACGSHLEWDMVVLKSIITDTDNLNLALNYTHAP